MASEAGTLCQFVLEHAWNCLNNTPKLRKRPEFGNQFGSYDALKSAAANVSLQFAPGMLDVVQNPEPPSIQYFKNLPTVSVSRWAIYAFVLEKPGSRALLYFGSGTNTEGGVNARLAQYARGYRIPVLMQQALDDGYKITHRGLICWISIPAARIVSITRVLFYLLEASHTYMFWGMHESAKDSDRKEFCLWDPAKLEYGGLCSHSALTDAIAADFNLTDDQIEANEQHRKDRKYANGMSWYNKQLDTDYVGFRAKTAAATRRSRAKNPELKSQQAAAKRERALEDETYHCEDCGRSFPDQRALDDHLASDRHKNVVSGNYAWFCDICRVPVSLTKLINRHKQSPTHVALAAKQAATPQTGIQQAVAVQKPVSLTDLSATKKPKLAAATGSLSDLSPSKKPKLAVAAANSAGMKKQASIKDFFTASNKENLAPVPKDPGEDSDGDIY